MPFLPTQVKGKYSRVPAEKIEAAKEDQKKADAAAVEADKATKAAAAELAAINKKADATPEQKAAAKKKGQPNGPKP